MDLLLVMNPQNSFFSESGSVYMGEKAEILKIRLIDFMTNFSKTKIFFREKHAQEDSFFRADKTHSITNTDDFQIHKDLKKYANLIDDKTRYDALFNTNLENQLMKEKAHTIGLIGVETHTSILFTAQSLCNRGYEVIIIEPCVMSRNNFLHSGAISIMRHSLGVIVSNG